MVVCSPQWVLVLTPREGGATIPPSDRPDCSRVHPVPTPLHECGLLGCSPAAITYGARKSAGTVLALPVSRSAADPAQELCQKESRHRTKGLEGPAKAHEAGS